MSVVDSRGREGSRFTQTIRDVQAGVAYLVRTPYGRPARDMWDVEVVAHDSLMPPRLYAVDRAWGVVTFEMDHAIVTVIARAVRQPVTAIGKRTS
ncbi:hypothetical protein ACFQE0_14115 [Methylobacterium komagatae]|uniref:Uncharacterized protein n=1 Tax=Methylobacterium komagatae TaxID=374425 RepID=A0ABW2BKL7_9HYPH